MAQVAEGVCMICAIQLWEHSPSYSPTDTNKNTLPDYDGPRWYLCLHAACETLARKATNTPASEIKTVADLWMTLDRRCVKAPDEGTLVPLCLPHVPNNKPGEPIELGAERYHIPWQAICTEESVLDDWSQEWWNYNPLDIPHLTEALVSNLERVEPSSTHKQFNTSLNNLPPKIKETITSFLIEGCTSLECTYLMPQSRWKDIMFQIPFLRDLEKDIIEAKEQEAVSGSFEWNWEKLAKQVLSEVPIFVSDDDDDDDDELENPWSYQTVGLTVPLGFTNRRRIWQILVDMYPNDVRMVHCLNEEDEDQYYDQDEET
ncbi:hypothetical protein FSST1_011631 [Fusarium sambucinum]